MLKAILLGSLLGLTGCFTTYDVKVAQISKIDDKSDAEELVKEINLSTVRILAETGMGSGVVLDQDLVLTAAHVVSHFSEPSYDTDGNLIPGKLVIESCVVDKSSPGVPYTAKAKVESIDAKLDLAILRLARMWPYTVAKMSKGDPYLYQRCWIGGHPHGSIATRVTEGRVQSLDDLDSDGAEFIGYSAPTTFGNSGGPVFIREDGKLVVVSIVQRVEVEGLQTAVTFLGYGRLPSHVRGFLKDALDSLAHSAKY